jgi:V-type H+-transporting ATPase proteolipid subunit
MHISAVGAAYGTSKSGIGIAGLGQFKPELIMKVRTPPPGASVSVCAQYGVLVQSLIPVVMSGIIAVYGLVVSVLIAGNRTCTHFLSAHQPRK